MTSGAAPIPGRRASIGAALLLAVYLLQGPLYFLAPFALLTLLARPRTLWELLWLTVGAAGVSATFVGDAGLAGDLLRASSVMLAVAFAGISWKSRAPLISRILLAVILTVAGVMLWTVAVGVGWTDIESAFTATLKAFAQSMADSAGTDASASREVLNLSQTLTSSAPSVARLFPGLLSLEAIAGLALAWQWHHKISRTPLGLSPARFRTFRFNDHLVWGAIFTLGLLLAPLPPAGHLIAANLLVVWAGLYVARGLAVVAAILSPAPLSLKVMAGGLAVLLVPVALGTWVTLGLADTWLDIRGRLKPPAP
jgi:hypothetical protein